MEVIKLNSMIVMGAIVGVLALIVAFQTIQIMGLNNKISGAAVTSSVSGGIDTTGWSADELMQYEHHGIVPARAQQGQQQAPSQGVGGC
ncbi:hypothetical protein A3K63_01560 [Candidatus Micrarchaeota archaeon RBG_16_49_10]|nr:MAG: hypothetical protein A3K63_01560 [Candidatus Micrarchaeota archaeon RBG_16_49_10]